MQVLTHNLLSMNSNRQLGINTKNKAQSSERLASGYRINRSADDAAGLQISEKMRWNIRGLDKCDGNLQDGVSLLQVADGALNEIHDMLHRMTELTIQAANDTNTASDRQAIQQEINKLLEEIDRIGHDTEFNTKKLFCGGYETMYDPDGNSIPVSQIPVGDFTLSSTELGRDVFSNYNSAGWYMDFSVSTTNGYTPSTWNLIYGNGSTSYSSILINYEDANGNQNSQLVDFHDLTPASINTDPANGIFKRGWNYTGKDGVSLSITQSIEVQANNGTEQYYNITYDIQNTGSTETDISLLFNADTAYNQNDYRDLYYMNGTKLDKSCVYTSNTDYKNQNPTYAQDIGSSSSLSIIDTQNALPFSENVKWDNSNKPSTISVGRWSAGQTGKWPYYDQLANKLGQSVSYTDLAFSLIWDKNDVAAGDATSINFQYGIIKASEDKNLDGVQIYYNNSTKVWTERLDLWIQSGATDKSGFFISIGAMDSRILGLHGIDVSTYRRASQTLDFISQANDIISKQRSIIGAQQNRLEHARSVDNNMEDNTQVSESKIRDTDMAEEMVNYSKHNILEQAGQTMLTQANQKTQSILSLFQ